VLSGPLASGRAARGMTGSSGCGLVRFTVTSLVQSAQVVTKIPDPDHIYAVASTSQDVGGCP
jgi:hypothetical protein